MKPSNVFIGDDGRVKLGDFGLACLAAESVRDKSGTKRYMAPEVLNGGEATEASDQYSLGVTLRELAIAQKTVPPDFDAILSKATANDPFTMPASAMPNSPAVPAAARLLAEQTGKRRRGG